MSIKVTRLPEAERRARHIAIGTFDGVHVGHRQVIDRADTVLTFEPHPLSVLHPEAAPKLIMPFEIKRDVIEGLGVEELVVIPFDEASPPSRRRTSARASWSTPWAPSVSPWGRTSASAPRRRATRRCSASREEFESRVVPLVEVDGEIVSSTRIRSLVAAGEVESATNCLGAPFLLEGAVVEGDGRGRTLGFPTANLVPVRRPRLPGHGVYAAFAERPVRPRSTSACGPPSRRDAGC